MMRYLRCGSSRLPTFAKGLIGSKRERVGREEQHGARDGRLAHGGVVEVLDRCHLRTGHLALEGRVGALDLRDEVRRHRRRFRLRSGSAGMMGRSPSA